jgi:DNA repair protein RadC
LALGAPALRTAELLAILIRSGRPGESSLQAGEKITAHLAGRIGQLPSLSAADLRTITPAVSEPAYCQIMAGVELGRRVADAMTSREPAVRLTGPQETMDFCRRHFARLASDGAQEEFQIVTLDAKHQVIGTHRVSIGLLDEALVHPREVFRPAIKDSAKSVVLVHNHPSGDPSASPADRKMTERLIESGRTLGIRVLDHIIVARGGSVSLRDDIRFQDD